MIKDPEHGGDRIVELTSLIETAKILNSSLDSGFILNHIMLASMGKLTISRTAAIIKKDLPAADGKAEFAKIGKGIVADDATIAELFLLDLESPQDPSQFNASLSTRLTKAGVTWVFALRSAHRLLGYLLVGKKMIGGPLTPSEIEFVVTLCNLAAAAIENASVFEQYKESNLQMQRRVQELQTLFELSKEFSQLIDEPRAIRTLEFSIMGQTGSRQFAICLMYESKTRLVVNRIIGIGSTDLTVLCPLEQAVRLSTLLQAPQDRAPNSNAVGLQKTVEELSRLGIKVLIPFHVQGATDGILLLGDRVSHAPYSDSEISFLSSLCNLAAMAIDNARLFQESLAKQRLEEELSLAHTIQEKLLPREMPQFSGCSVSTFHIPSKQVGGDYFDVIKVGEDRLYFAIADVSGKGFPAALLMANLQSAFRALVATGLELDQILARLNNIVHANTDMDKFITLFAGIYDRSENVLTYINAGHNYPFLIKHDRVLRLDKGGLMLGVLSDVKYEIGREPVAVGDVLYMFTDGVNEALDAEGSQFSDERLAEVLLKNSTLGAGDILEEVRKEIAAFVGGAPQSDDITQLCISFS